MGSLRENKEIKEVKEVKVSRNNFDNKRNTLSSNFINNEMNEKLNQIKKVYANVS